MPNLGVGTRGCSHEKAVAPDRSAVSLLHLAEQAPAEVVGALSQLVEAGRESPAVTSWQQAHGTGPSRRLGLGERARLSAESGELLGRRGGVCRRKEPRSYEAGLRAHGSNQRFHRLLGHAVLRAPTTAPSLTGLDPAARRILTLQGWRRKRRPGRCPVNPLGRGGGRDRIPASVPLSCRGRRGAGPLRGSANGPGRVAAARTRFSFVKGGRQAGPARCRADDRGGWRWRCGGWGVRDGSAGLRVVAAYQPFLGCHCSQLVAVDLGEVVGHHQ